jgi:hypothetical protein
LRPFHLEKIAQDYGAQIGIVFLVSVILVVIQIVTSLWQKLHAKKISNDQKEESLEALHCLDRKEKSILREFFIQGQKTLQLPIDQVSVSGLINKGILCMAGNMGERSLAGLLCPVKISPFIERHLIPPMIGLPSEPPTDADIQFLRENRPDFIPEIARHNELFHTSWDRRPIRY